jgi:hypothetical protein
MGLCALCMQAQAQQAAPSQAQASHLEQMALLLRSSVASPMFARALQQQLALQQERARGGAAAMQPQPLLAQAGNGNLNGFAPPLQPFVFGAAQNGLGAAAAAAGQLPQPLAAPQANRCVQLSCFSS